MIVNRNTRIIGFVSLDKSLQTFDNDRCFQYDIQSTPEQTHTLTHTCFTIKDLTSKLQIAVTDEALELRSVKHIRCFSLCMRS